MGKSLKANVEYLRVLFPPEETLVEENDKITALAQGYVIGHLHELNRDQASPVRS